MADTMDIARALADAPDLPRAQQGSNSQRLLSGLLADYSFESTPGLSSASIVRMLGEFGITPAAARTALSRVSRRGLLELRPTPRGPRYNISERSRATHLERLGRVVRFGAEHPAWDGQWVVVAFSVSERQRALRSRLRLALEKLGLAPMTDAVWVTPHDHADAVAAIAAELDVRVAVLRAREYRDADTGMSPLDAFPLDRYRAAYDEYRARFGPYAERAARGELAPAEALVVRTEVLRNWRSISLSDPDLPPEILPADWPQAAARELFLTTWRALAPLALLRIRDLVAEFDPETAEQLDWVEL